MFLKKNKDDQKITFWSRFDGIASIPDIKPYKLNVNMPDWWKTMGYVQKSVKGCPGILDLTSSVYVLPMWTDIEIYIHDRESRLYSWATLLNEFEFQEHQDRQLLDHVDQDVYKRYIGVLKAVCPWFLKTPPGYSVIQIPAFYSFNNDFDVPTGIIDTDIYHEINAQLMIKSKKDSFVIERGQPLAYFLPFKRNKLSLEVREGTAKDRVNENISKYAALTKFSGGYRKYRSEIEGH